MPSAIKSPGHLANPLPGPKSQRRLVLLMLAWTVFVALALWWLLRSTPELATTGPWVMHRGDAVPQPFGERVRDWFRLLDLNFQRIYPWVLLGPYVGWLAWHYSLERGRLRLSLPVHLGACVLFVLASYAINSRSSMRVARVVIITSQQDDELTSAEPSTHVRVEFSERASGGIGGEAFTGGLFTRHTNGGSMPDVLTVDPKAYFGAANTNFFFKSGKGLPPALGPPELPTMRPLTTLLDLLAYGAIVGLAHSVHFYRRFREREHRALFLESNLAKARLGALQAQLQPHFLFNSLNAIAALLRRDPKLAEATLTSLSDLLRLTLSQSEKQEVPLREELNVISRYMEIQQTRFGERLCFEPAIEPAALDCLVPTLLLQPVVENAIRHGIEPSEKTGLVRLSAARQGERLVLTVEDDGVGFRESEVDASQALRSASCQESHSSAEAVGRKEKGPERSQLSYLAEGVGTALNHEVSSLKAGTGIGLTNLRARLEALYGQQQLLEIGARQPAGVRVRIEIPWRPVSEPAETAAVKA